MSSEQSISLLVTIIFSILQPKKKKNVSYDAFGTKEGRIHMQKQDLSKLQLRKMKGLKRTSSESGSSPGGKRARSAD